MEIKTKEVLKENEEMFAITNFLSFVNFWTWNPQTFTDKIIFQQGEKREVLTDYANLARYSAKIIDIVSSVVARAVSLNNDILEEEAKIEEIEQNGYVSVQSKGLTKKDDIRLRKAKIKEMRKAKSELLSFKKANNERDYGDNLRSIYRSLRDDNLFFTQIGKQFANSIASTLSQEMFSRFKYSLTGYEDDYSADSGVEV